MIRLTRMMRMTGWYLGLLPLLSGLAYGVNVEIYEFANPTQEKTYQALVTELRCLVCQNQNIADSNAELAQDMRRKTYELVIEGKSQAEIADYMVVRYGDFVRYKPPFKATTAILWIGPFALLGIALWFLLQTIRKQQQPAQQRLPNQQQLQQAAKLLDQTENT